MCVSDVLAQSRNRGQVVTIHNIPNSLTLDAYWMPFTANRQFKAAPRLLASAEGMHYTTVDGRKVLDGIGRAVVRQCRARSARRSPPPWSGN